MSKTKEENFGKKLKSLFGIKEKHVIATIQKPSTKEFIFTAEILKVNSHCLLQMSSFMFTIFAAKGSYP